MDAATAANLDDPIVDHIRRDFASLRADATVGDALAALRGQELPGQIIYFYAIDADGRLLGVVPTRRLLMADPGRTVRELCAGKVVAVPATATVLDACEQFLVHRFLALPVVDAERRLLGVVDLSLFSAEMDLLSERTAAEDIFQLIGVRLERARQGPLRAFRARFPWLLTNIAGGIACAVISGLFTGLLETRIILALFVPVVLALSESVSIQSVTIALQQLHGGGNGGARLAGALWRELPTGALLGLASGGLVAVVAALWRQDAAAAAVIWVSILLAMVTACLIGVTLPFLVRLAGRDPRFATGPVVLASGDVACLLIYFTLASWWLQPGR